MDRRCLCAPPQADFLSGVVRSVGRMFEEEPEERLGDSIAALLPVLVLGCSYGEDCPGSRGCVVASVFAELAEGPLTADAVRVLAGVDPGRPCWSSR